MKFVRLSMFIECITVVSGITQSILLNLRRSWRGTKPVYRVTLCIMDKPIKIGRQNSGCRRDTETKNRNVERRLLRETVHKVRLMLSNERRDGEKKEWFEQMKKEASHRADRQRSMQMNKQRVEFCSDRGSVQKVFQSEGRWYIGRDAAVLEYISTAVAYSLSRTIIA